MRQEELICIGCPMGCNLTVIEENGEFSVTGNTCPRGKDYAEKELTDPRRTVTSSVRVSGGSAVMVPVKTVTDIPKGKIGQCMQEIHQLAVTAPVRIGDVICENIADTGVALVATKNVE